MGEYVLLKCISKRDQNELIFQFNTKITFLINLFESLEPKKTKAVHFERQESWHCLSQKWIEFIRTIQN